MASNHLTLGMVGEIADGLGCEVIFALVKPEAAGSLDRSIRQLDDQGYDLEEALARHRRGEDVFCKPGSHERWREVNEK